MKLSVIFQFVMFVIKLLQEQGIGVDQVVKSFVEERGLDVRQHVNLVAELRELGLDLHVPTLPEGKLVETSREKDVRERKEAEARASEFDGHPDDTPEPLAVEKEPAPPEPQNPQHTPSTDQEPGKGIFGRVFGR